MFLVAKSHAVPLDQPLSSKKTVSIEESDSCFHSDIVFGSWEYRNYLICQYSEHSSQRFVRSMATINKVAVGFRTRAVQENSLNSFIHGEGMDLR